MGSTLEKVEMLNGILTSEKELEDLVATIGNTSYQLFQISGSPQSDSKILDVRRAIYILATSLRVAWSDRDKLAMLISQGIHDRINS